MVSIGRRFARTDDQHADGVFHPEALAHVHDLASYAKTLHWKNADGESEGVIGIDLLAPSTVDNMSQGSLGSVRFEWLMPEPPTTREAALAVRDRALHRPFLNGTLVARTNRRRRGTPRNRLLRFTAGHRR